MARFRDAARRRARKALSPLLHHGLVGTARVVRPRIRRIPVVGITGSGGKTTTKDLLVAVLRTRGEVRSHRSSLNRARTVARTVLGTRSSTRAVVQELAANGPGSLDTLLRVLQPNVAVVTSIQLDHFRAFRTREAVAAEKGKLVAALPPDGLAVLNADDPLVLAMAQRTRARVVTYGLGAAADVRGERATAAWPERLSLTVHANGSSAVVRTQLCGRHWSTAVLAALAAGTALGVPLEEAAAALSDVEPETGRMSAVELPDGVTFIRDDWKAPLTSIDDVLTFLGEARAARKVLVVGTLADFGGDSGRKYRQVAQRAVRAADEVLFVGRWSSHVRKLLGATQPGALRAFPTVRGASDYLAATLGRGDLVVLKGNVAADHLGRIVLARQRQIACWRTGCGRRTLCESCVLRMVPSRS